VFFCLTSMCHFGPLDRSATEKAIVRSSIGAKRFDRAHDVLTRREAQARKTPKPAPPEPLRIIVPICLQTGSGQGVAGDLTVSPGIVRAGMP